MANGFENVGYARSRQQFAPRFAWETTGRSTTAVSLVAVMPPVTFASEGLGGVVGDQPLGVLGLVPAFSFSIRCEATLVLDGILFTNKEN